MELKIWPLLYVEVYPKPLNTNHHKPAPWKDARPEFKRFDCQVCRTEGAVMVGEPKPRMPWRLWIYWKDAVGVVWGRHIDWLWFPPKRWCTAVGKSGG